MAANSLARAGVNFRIVDKRPMSVPAGQADGIQPRTIEVLQVSIFYVNPSTHSNPLDHRVMAWQTVSCERVTKCT